MESRTTFFCGFVIFCHILGFNKKIGPHVPLKSVCVCVCVCVCGGGGGLINICFKWRPMRMIKLRKFVANHIFGIHMPMRCL